MATVKSYTFEASSEKMSTYELVYENPYNGEKNPGVVADERVQAYRLDHQDVTYENALKTVLYADPKLKAAYVKDPGEIVYVESNDGNAIPLGGTSKCYAASERLETLMGEGKTLTEAFSQLTPDEKSAYNQGPDEEE